MESGFSFCGRCPQSPTKGVTPLEPDTKKTWDKSQAFFMIIMFIILAKT